MEILFGRSKAKLLTEAHGRVTFQDVAGVEEAKVEKTKKQEKTRNVVKNILHKRCKKNLP